jgi:hypothetical protein
VTFTGASVATIRRMVSETDASVSAALTGGPDLTFGAGAFNPTVFAEAAILLLVIAAAFLMPARRAATVAPVKTLHAECATRGRRGCRGYPRLPGQRTGDHGTIAPPRYLTTSGSKFFRKNASTRCHASRTTKPRSK